MVIVNDMNASRAPGTAARPSLEAQRAPEASEGVGRADGPSRQGRRIDGTVRADETGSFGSLLNTVQASVGRHLETRGVEAELNNRMFEPPPDGVRERANADARNGLAAGEVRDARRIRFERANDASGPALASVDHAAPPTAQSAGTRNATQTSAEAPHARATGVAVGSGSSSAAGGTQSPPESGALAANQAHRAGDRAVGGAGVNAVSLRTSETTNPPAAPVSTSAGKPNGTQSAAQQVGQLLKTGSSGEVETARATTGPASQGETRGEAKRGTHSGVDGKGAGKAGGPSGADRAGEARRLTEPTPFDELVRSIRMRTGSRVSSARMRLDPPELGRVQVDVRVAGERAEIRVRTETPQAVDRLNERAAALRIALEQHGIRVERFDIYMDTAEFDDASPGSSGFGQPDEEAGSEGLWGEASRIGVDPPPVDADGTWFEPDAAALWSAAEWSGVVERRVDIRV